LLEHGGETQEGEGAQQNGPHRGVSCCGFYVSDWGFDHHLAFGEGNHVYATEEVTERFGEPEAVGKEVGRKVVGGAVSAERVVGGHQH